jgi:beta-aspartyl-peptidase (threonine type)
MRKIVPALIAHGGAGARGVRIERPERRSALIAAVRAGARILRDGGGALDAVQAVVVELENSPLFNAGTGSVLTTIGTVEMDASIMAMEPRASGAPPRITAGAVAAVTRVKNPIVLARVVMEHTPHVIMAGPGAHRLARRFGIPLCANETLITQRARERWIQRRNSAAIAGEHGTVGAVAIDSRGAIAAATSTGGVPGKIPGRVGDSAVIGAGTYVDAHGGASATGHGESIILSALCREATTALASGRSPQAAARDTIGRLLGPMHSEAGVIIVDRKGRVGFAHNAEMMQVALYQSSAIRHFWADPVRPRDRQ